MIIDSHVHWWPPFGDLSEWDYNSVAERNRDAQKYVLLLRTATSFPIRRVEDNVIVKEAWKDLWDMKLWGSWEGLCDVKFRVKERKCVWEKDGTEYYMDMTNVYPGTSEELVPFMDKVGVDKAVFHCGRFLNRYCSRLMHRHPGRFLSLGHVEEEKAYTKEKMENLHMYIEELGLKGLYWDANDPAWEGYSDFHEDKYDPFWREVGSLGVPIYLTPHSEEDLPRLKRLLEKFSSLKIVIVHGYPPRFLLKGEVSDSLREMAVDIVKNYDVYLEVLPNASRLFEHPKLTELLKYLYETFGPSKLVWGSELGALVGEKRTPKFYAEQLHHLEKNCDYMSKNDLSLIHGGNLQRVFRI